MPDFRGLPFPWWRPVTPAVNVLPPQPQFDNPPVLTFPSVPLDLRIELQLGGTWTNVSGWVVRNPLLIGRGHPDESTTTAPTSLSLTLANADGRFSAKNPSGPYYGNLKRNTPVRVSVPEGASYLRLENDSNIATSYAGTPSSAALQITGDLEIQLDVTLDNWNSPQILACMWAESTSQRSWMLLLNDTGTLTFVACSDGAGNTQHSYGSRTRTWPSPPLLRQSLRVTWQAATGTATFYTSPQTLGASPSWTQQDQLVNTTVASLFASAAPVQVGYGTDVGSLTTSTVTSTMGVFGKVHAFLLLSGISGVTAAAPDFTAQSPGATSFTDAHANVWTLGGTSEISSRKYRCHVEASSWPQAQDPTGHVNDVTVTTSGVLRRISMGTTPARSAMERAYVRLPANLQLAGYWPCEDGTGSGQVASVVGGLPASAPGVTLASFSGFTCSQPIPVMNGGSIFATLGGSGPSVTWTDSVIRFLLAVPAADDTNNAVVCRVYTSGTIARMELVYQNNGVLGLNCYNAAGAAVAGAAVGPFTFSLANLAQCRVSMEIRGNNTTGLWVVTPGGAYYNGGGGTFSGTVGAVTALTAGGGLVGSAIGHLSVQGTWDTLQDLGQPLNAWQGETAATRFARLCNEENIACRIRGQAAASAAMGPQTQQTIQSLLQECADADLGMIFEPRQVRGLGYRTRQSTGNMPAAVTLSYAQNHLDPYSSPPVEDDQIVVNDVTVTQPSTSNSTGTQSQARQVADTGNIIDGGNLGVTAIGRYDQTYPVNVLSSQTLNDNAGTRLRAGTVDEPRYPGIDVDLVNTDLVTAGLLLPLLDLDIGDRLVIQVPPPWLPPGPADQVDQVINGVQETLFVRAVLHQSWQGIPYSPWPMGVVGDTFYGWADTDGSTVHANATYGAGTIQIDSTGSNPVWSQTGSDYPLLLQCAGQVIQVTWLSGTTSPQTFTVNAWGVNGVQQNLTAGQPVSLAYPAYAGM